MAEVPFLFSGSLKYKAGYLKTDTVLLQAIGNKEHAMPQEQKIEVVQAFEPSRKHIRAGDVFIYRMSNGSDYYGLVAKHKFDLGGFKNCLLLYFFDATAQDVAINELSVRNTACCSRPPWAAANAGAKAIFPRSGAWS